MRHLITWLILISLSLTILAPSAEARRHKRRRHRKHLTIINEKKLYERLGGKASIASIVDEWLRLSLADKRINSSFAAMTAKPDRIVKMRREMADQVCELADGPCQYRGPDMKKVHGRFEVDDQQFLIFVDNLYQSLQKYNVNEREKDELLARFSDLRADIVHGAEPEPTSEED